MTDWMLTDKELSVELGLPVEENIITESERQCVVIAQRKLLEYLIVNVEVGAFYTKNLMRQMLKELEGQNG